MSKYNSYAKKLDEAFKKARASYTDAYNKMQDAKDKADASNSVVGRRSEEDEIRRQESELAYKKAKEEFNSVQRNVWREYESTVERLTNDLQQEIDRNNVASPDSIDDHGLKLLESGLMTINDYKSMAESYADNPTMLRFVSKYAQEEADKLTDVDETKERQAFIDVVNQTKENEQNVLNDWDSLVNIANVYDGQTRSDNSPEFICSMSAKWDGENVQNAIDSF